MSTVHALLTCINTGPADRCTPLEERLNNIEAAEELWRPRAARTQEVTEQQRAIAPCSAACARDSGLPVDAVLPAPSTGFRPGTAAMVNAHRRGEGAWGRGG